MPTHHLAQLNVATMRAPQGDPIMADFFANIARINQMGDAAPGFVWRLKDEDSDNATALRLFDALTIFNLTVWESLDALYQFSYYSDHAAVFRRRAEWFHKPTEATLALWWIPAGHIPTVEESKARLLYLRAHGPTPYAFTFKQPFTAQQAQAYDSANQTRAAH